MNIKKVLCVLFIFVCFSFSNCIIAATLSEELVISGTTTINNSNNRIFKEIKILAGGKLQIDSGNIEIKADEFIIENGGVLTYHSNQNSNKNMNVKLNVNNARIDGQINFKGLNAPNKGRAGSHKDGANADSGKYGKNIVIDAFEMEIRGTINTNGGNGGNGGGGGHDDLGIGDPGDGGNGGDGGKAGDVAFSASCLNIYRTAKILSNGGDGGKGGNGGDPGTIGDGADGGDGGNGGDAGFIDIRPKFLLLAGNIESLGGKKGSGGSRTKGGLFGSNGKNGDPGDHDGVSINPKVYVGYYDISGNYNQYFSPNPIWRGDERPPEPEGDFDIYLLINNKELRDNIIINDKNPILKWKNFIDNDYNNIPASGIKEYTIYLNDGRLGTSRNPEKQIAYLSDGEYEVQISATDNNNRISPKYPTNDRFKFIIDTEPPLIPYIRDIEISKDEVTVYWKSSIDNYALSHYQLEIYDTKTGRLLADTNNIGSNINQYPLHSLYDFQANQSFNLRICAVDEAGNASSWDEQFFTTLPEISEITSHETAWDEGFYISLEVLSVGEAASEYRYIRESRVNDNYILDYTSDWFNTSVPAGKTFMLRDSEGELVSRGNYRYFIETRDSQGQNIVRSRGYNISLVNNKPVFQGVISPQDSALLSIEEINLKIKPFIDPDGDQLIYTYIVEYYQNGEWHELQVNNEDVIIAEDEVSLLVDLEREGDYRWQVEVTDSYDTVSSPVFRFTIDYTPPELSYKVYDSEGQREINATNQGKILIKEIELSDEVVKLEFWEGESRLATFTETFPESLTLELSSGEGTKQLRALAYDQAGNIQEIIKNIIFDQTPPEHPSGLILVAGRNQLEISWDNSNDSGEKEARSGVSGYILSYQSLEREKSGEIFIEQVAEPRYILADLWDNEKIEVQLYTLDYAGNMSTTVNDIGYSLAECGVIIGFTFNNAETYQEYTVILDIKEVRAAEYRIIREQLIDGELTDRVTGDWLDINCLQYIDDNLQAHARYYYKIETRNKGKVQEGNLELESFLFKVPNQLPTEPLIQEYNFVNNLPLVLRTEGAVDSDRDSLNYYFILKDSQGNIVVDYEPGNREDGMSYQYDGELHSGDTLLWQVAVTDGFLNEDEEAIYIYSSEIETTIDQELPVISLTEEVPSNYVAELELEIILEDNISGLKNIEYYWNQEEILPVDREKIIISGLDGIDQYILKLSSEIPEGDNNLYLKVLDLAGNESVKNIRTRVDRTPPVLYDLKLNGQQVNGTLYTTSADSIAAEWKFADEYTGMDYYYYALLTAEELDDISNIPEERFILVDEDYRQDRVNFAQIATVSLEENSEYYLLVEGVNTAGLSSGSVISEGIVIDSRAPFIEGLELVGLKELNGKYYCNNLSLLNLELNVHDHGGSGVKELRYALVENIQHEQSSIDWKDSLDQLFNSAQAISGKEYYLAVQAIDNLDQLRVKYSQGFTYTDTPPKIKEIMLGSPLEIVSPEDSYHSRPGVPIPLTIEIEDKVELDSISYGVGSNPGTNDIIDWVDFAEIDFINYLQLELELEAGTYYVNIRVENKAGLVSTGSSNPLCIGELLASTPFVSFNSEYTTDCSQLQFYWDCASDIEVIAYQFRIVNNMGTSLGDWKNIDNKALQGTYTVKDLNLENGEEYFVYLRAIYQDGTYSPAGVSRGITVDNTAPEKIFIDDGSYISGNNLYLEWGAEDQESGIRGYRIKIGKEPGSDELSSGYIELDQSGSTTIRDLQFKEGELYYTTLEVINGANLISETSSNGFRVDNTPPDEPRISTESRYVNEFKLSYDWRWSQEDPVSGLQEYHIALLSNRQVNSYTQWIVVDKETEAVFTENLQEGQWYYLAVKAVNQAGLSSIAYSEPVMIDTTAPSPPRIDDGGDYIFLDDSGFASLTVAFASADDESGLSHYLFSLGIDQDRQKIIADRKVTESEMSKGEIDLIDLPLIPGEVYFFTVLAIDKAGLVSMESRSSGFMVISGYPVITNINDYGDYNSFSDQFLVSWSCEDTGYAPIDYYQIELSTDLINWVAVKEVGEEQVLIRSEDLGQDSFIDGEVYYISVQGVNKAGVKTPAAEAGITDGIRIDSTAPENLNILYSDTHSTENFKIRLEAFDPHSGIGAYRFAVGSSRGDCDLTGGWIIQETDKVVWEEYLTLPLKHKQSFYVSSQARNKAGLWSDILSSENAVIADLTPPEIIEFEADKYINVDKRVSFNWQAIDPETGITAYRYQLLEEETDFNWEGVPVYNTESEVNQVEFNVKDDEVLDGKEYRLILQVRNRLNLWSDPVEQRLYVDLFKPVIELVNPMEIVTNNGQAEIVYSINEFADVNFSLYRLISNDEKEFISMETVQGVEAGKEVTYQFEEPEMLAGSFLLKLEAVDLAGNQSEIKDQLIRINAKPEIDLGINRNLYKGRAMEFSANASDPDGELVYYQWDFGDGNTSNEISPIHIYKETGIYIVTLTCIDNDDGIGRDQIEIRVSNTLEGELALDENWSGDMELRDTVIVPEGLTLLIEAGTNIKIPAEKGLIINGSLKIMGTENNMVYFNSNSQMNWHGIRINSQSSEIDLQYAIIENGLRGIAFIECGGKINNLVFKSNQYGIHLYQAYSEIVNSQFKDNEFFGIKEDGDCLPILRNNIFLNNQIGDYYHSSRTILSEEALEELNKSDMGGE